MGDIHPLLLISAGLLILFTSSVNSETLTPPYFNLAEGRKITASSTCGVDIDGPELYCKLVGSTTDDQQNQTTFNDDTLTGWKHVVIQGQVGDLKFSISEFSQKGAFVHYVMQREGKREGGRKSIEQTIRI